MVQARAKTAERNALGCHRLLISLDSAKAPENLTNAENNWLDFRKTQGVFVAMGAHGGSPDKALLVASFTKTTEARIAQLKEWQASQEKSVERAK